MPRESQLIYFRGTPLHYSVSVPDGGANAVAHRVLIISSPLVPISLWEKLEEVLAASGCMTVIAELPGFAGSYHPGDSPTDPPLLATMLWGLLDQIDDQHRSSGALWHIMSHGTSGNIALQMVRRSPGSISSQIYISPVFALDLPPNITRMREIYASVVSSRSSFSRFLHYYVKAPGPLSRDLIDSMHGELSRRGSADTFIRTLRQAQTTRIRGMDFGPCMVILGRMDPLCTDQALHEIDRLLPGAEKHSLSNCGHFPMITHNRATGDYLRGWLQFIKRGH